MFEKTLTCQFLFFGWAHTKFKDFHRPLPLMVKFTNFPGPGKDVDFSQAFPDRTDPVFQHGNEIGLRTTREHSQRLKCSSYLQSSRGCFPLERYSLVGVNVQNATRTK